MPINSTPLPTELVGLIFEQLFILDPAALRTASTCCRQYRDLAMRLLDQSIRFKYAYRDRLHARGFLESLLANGGERARRIQNIAVDSRHPRRVSFLDSLIIALLHTVNNLVSFEWNPIWLIPTPIVQELNSRWPQCRLSLNSFITLDRDKMDAFISSPCLFSLSTSFEYGCGDTHPRNIVDILTSCPNLRHFEFRTKGKLGPRPSSYLLPEGHAYTLKPGATLPPLTRMVLIECPMFTPRVSTMWSQAADWTHLQHLTLSKWHNMKIGGFLSAFHGRTPSLREFAFDDTVDTITAAQHERLNTRYLSRFLHSISALEVLDLSTAASAFPALAPAIYHHAPTLRAFRFHCPETCYEPYQSRTLNLQQLSDLGSNLPALESLTLDIDIHNARALAALTPLAHLSRFTSLALYTDSRRLRDPPVDPEVCARVFKSLHPPLRSLVFNVGEEEIPDRRICCQAANDAEPSSQHDSSRRSVAVVDRVRIELKLHPPLRIFVVKLGDGTISGRQMRCRATDDMEGGPRLDWARRPVAVVEGVRVESERAPEPPAFGAVKRGKRFR
ncbi:hypothetical protein BU16DRAFT_565344 [Lophium mytilinum]|uniref:F-box domain-containing protein n=1 Tax=Lophium mytilinum TaxID=390894 RepID=A0A6A6QJ02_9PEZI|nr:hypothetical protein BU16DRAFT_565344 [Lophium mytilinum]